MICSYQDCVHNNEGKCKLNNPEFEVKSNMPLSYGTRVICASVEYKK